ncbi:hypothetical protein ACA910_003292 [Epithemia clementina (nom. ined.)]
MNDPLFVESHSSEARKTMPLPILAITRHVAQVTEVWFPLNTMELVIPVHCISGAPLNSHYHSVVRPSLFLVNWQSQFPGLTIPCPSNACNRELKASRTNFSKNKKLFPMFRLTGPPLWSIVMSYKCNTCKIRYNGNGGNVLKYLPDFVQSAYPVEPKYATTGLTSHIDCDNCSHMMVELMVTHGNGNLLARLIYSRINKEYLCQITEYLAYWCFYQAGGVEHEGVDSKSLPMYPKLDGEYITMYPPAGDLLCNLFDTTTTSNRTVYRISNHD